MESSPIIIYVKDRAPEVQGVVQGVQFVFSADVIVDFLCCPWPETPCFLAVPLTDERRTLETHSTECPFTRAQCMLYWKEGALTRRFACRATAATEEAARPSTSASEASLKKGAPAVPSSWVSQLFANLDSRVSATVKAALQPLEGQVKSLEEEMKKLRTTFEGECTVMMLCNKSVVVHMVDVSEQFEEIKKTLDDFKTEANPRRILGDIPDDVATFRDAVRR
ncbi:hypothetical protein CJ030_MR5G015916 [Morella rubra]|uniref:Uncharacterized protein n=1 Tax=Morella rubra TaxID=262757 RepID=A0A6A1VMH4_9ROSI|nr:hypothetical protein CJ030_MR5G015916 [Morella rubra]